MTFEQSEHVLDKATLILEDTVDPAFHISEEIADKLLEKLSSDNEFRAVFQKSPRIALAYLGHEAATNANVSDKGVWSCMRCTTLADASVIKASSELLRLQFLSSKAALTPIRLQA
ncbi:MAG: NHLP-related RiPP peptide [Arenimonas sp.]